MAGPFKIHIHQVGKYNIYPASGPVLDIFFIGRKLQELFSKRSCTSYTQQAVLYKIYSIDGLVQDILNRRSGTRYTQYGGLVLDILNRRFCTDIPNSQAGWNNKQGILKMQSVTYIMKHAQNTNYKLLYYSQFHQ